MTEPPKQPGNAAETDPGKLFWMVGSPPPADKLVLHEDLGHFSWPKTRWAFANLRQVVPTSRVWRGSNGVSMLPAALREDIDSVTFTPLGGDKPMTWKDSLAANYTDAILVLHNGKIVYEAYPSSAMAPQNPHICFSVTKSYFGTIAENLVHDGLLDENALVPKYIPELAGSAYGDATVRQVMDMRIGVKYTEDYADPGAGVWEGARASGIFPRPADWKGSKSTYEFLSKLEKEGEHGGDFFYKTTSTDVLGWLIRRVTNKNLGELLSERVWQKLGCEEDASMMLDTHGTESAGGGLSATLRDMARFGECIRLGGEFNGNRIFPKEIIESIRKNGDPSAFVNKGPKTIPGGAYRSMWWITNNEHGAFSARGIHGQAIYIDPTANMVICRFASHPMAANVHFDPTSLPAFHAVAKHLMASK